MSTLLSATGDEGGVRGACGLHWLGSRCRCNKGQVVQEVREQRGRGWGRGRGQGCSLISRYAGRNKWRDKWLGAEP